MAKQKNNFDIIKQIEIIESELLEDAIYFSNVSKRILENRQNSYLEKSEYARNTADKLNFLLAVYKKELTK